MISRFKKSGRIAGLALAVAAAVQLAHGQAQPPVITGQPSDRTASAGDNVSFSVTATGSALSYQWFHNGFALVGATAATLVIGNAQIADAGVYFVTVTSFADTNLAARVTSNPAVLRGANPPPTLTTQPASRAASAGETVVLSVAATGAGTLQYQWRRNGFPISGAIGATLTISAVNRSDIDLYDVRVNDGLSVTYSDRVRLDVQPSATPTGLGLDPGFNVSLESEGGSVIKLRRAPDGKILIAGNFPHYDGATKPNLARLTADGSIDSTFVGAVFDAPVIDVAVQPDGKLIVAGLFTQIDNLIRSSVARLNPDGTPDAAFVPEPTLAIRSVLSVALQTDGKILLAGDFTTTVGGIARSNLIRLLPNGTLDAAYNSAPDAAVRSIALQPDGKLLVAGAFTTIGGSARRYLARLNADGTIDPGFDPGTGPGGTTNVVKLTANGSVLIGGAFSQFNGTAAPSLLRLRTDGTRDPAFVGVNTSITDLALLADGKIAIVGSFQSLNGSFVSGNYGFARLNADGSPDFTFAADSVIAGGVASVLALDDGRTLLGGAFGKFTFAKQLGGVAAFSPTGKLDPAVRGTLVTGSVSALAPLAGGKFLVGGRFSRVNGVARTALIRLDPDGSLDSAFTASPDDSVSGVAVQGDGRIVITGAFTSIAGTGRAGVARLNADGSLDPSFDFRDAARGANGSGVNVAALAEGRVLLAANNISSLVPNRRTFARLRADGSLDAEFVPFTGASITAFLFTDFAVLADERILYSNDGSFSSGGIKPAVLGRLATDGRLDPTFTPGVTPFGGGGIQSFAPQPDGKILLGGSFTNYNGATRNRLARLLPDGAIDPAFVPSLSSTNNITRVLPARDGTLYVFRQGIAFGSQAPLATALTRLTSAQVEDPTFFAAFTTATTGFPAVLLLDDGNLLIAGGEFREGATVRSGLVRTRAVTGPVIVTQPAATTALAGANVALSVNVVGVQNPTYLWSKDGVPIAGVQGATYVIRAAQAGAAGSYSVHISYTGGSLDSAAATVTITASAPAFSSAQPAPIGFGATLQAGTRFALTAPTLVSGSAPVIYQWSKDGVALPGETGAFLFRRAWLPDDTGSYRVTATNSLGTAASAATVQAVAANQNWTWLNPLPQGNAPTFVYFLNGNFFAGTARGTILRSADGLNWTPSSTGSSTTIGPIAFGNGTYVALALFGGLFTSGDGTTWGSRESGLTDERTLFQLAFGGGRFVAVGTTGTILSSIDGRAWTSASVPTSDSFAGVAFGGGQWLALSARNQIFSSSDATTWTAGAVLPESVSTLAYGAGMFAITSGFSIGAAYSSPDGVTWTRPFNYPHFHRGGKSRWRCQ